jgi:hypothetical protein
LHSRIIKFVVITGEVYKIQPFCGGAAPPQNVVDHASMEVPYHNKKFYIKKGNINNLTSAVIDSFITDSLGQFRLRLPVGQYCLLQPQQMEKLDSKKIETRFIKADSLCLQAWWAKPYHVLVVKKTNNKPLRFVFQKRCYITSDIPCLHYNGPMHP